MSQPFSIQRIPGSAIGESDERLVVLRITPTANGRPLLVSVRATTAGAPALDPVDAAAVVVDVLRPGWARAVEMFPPILRDGTLFNGFSLRRSALLPHGNEEMWELRCLAAGELAQPFDMGAVIRDLDHFHQVMGGEEVGDE